MQTLVACASFATDATRASSSAIGLGAYADRADVVVLALPRGGVPVAYEVASYLNAPLDVLIVRKLGVPGHAELAMGAIASGGVQVVDRRIVDAMRVSRDAFAVVVDSEREELSRRERLFRGDRPPLDVRGKIVILVDDGLATGATMLAAIQAIHTRQPARVVTGVPVASPSTAAAVRVRVDELVCLATPRHFQAVGLWFEDFSQTTDAEVRELLAHSQAPDLKRFLYTNGGSHDEPVEAERKR